MLCYPIEVGSPPCKGIVALSEIDKNKKLCHNTAMKRERIGIAQGLTGCLFLLGSTALVVRGINEIKQISEDKVISAAFSVIGNTDEAMSWQGKVESDGNAFKEDALLFLTSIVAADCCFLTARENLAERSQDPEIPPSKS